MMFTKQSLTTFLLFGSTTVFGFTIQSNYVSHKTSLEAGVEFLDIGTNFDSVSEAFKSVTLLVADSGDMAVNEAASDIAAAAADAAPAVAETALEAISPPSWGGGGDGGLGDVPIPAVAAGGVLFAGAYAFLKTGGGGDPVESSTTAAEAPATVADGAPAGTDVSIPYDAAARMAYCSSKGISTVDDESAFQTFKPTYEAEAVALVTAKKAARDTA